MGADELQADARKLIEREQLQIGEEACNPPLQSIHISDELIVQVLSIKDADFSWSKTSLEPTLEGISLSVKKGELVGILGRVGAGKVNLVFKFLCAFCPGIHVPVRRVCCLLLLVT